MVHPICVRHVETGQRLQPCPEADPPSCALYFYTEPGDHIGFHYDTSYYKGTRYTVLVGLLAIGVGVAGLGAWGALFHMIGAALSTTAASSAIV